MTSMCTPKWRRNCLFYLRPTRLRVLLTVLPFTTLILPTAPLAMLGQTGVCDTAADYAASETGVPLQVLKALTRTETGRKTQGQFAPWPWAVNMEGKGQWFASRDEARSFAYLGYKSGSRSFDVGCFQINYKWHGAAFASLDDMFDPQKNALYAASFLKQLYSETGNWSDAAAAYHSRTPEYASKYKTRFDRILAELKTNPENVPAETVRSRPETRFSRNEYPLLVHDNPASQRMGSLVPVTEKSGRGLWFRIGS